LRDRFGLSNALKEQWSLLYGIAFYRLKRFTTVVAYLHDCAIACTLKQTFAQCKISLEGTLPRWQLSWVATVLSCISEANFHFRGPRLFKIGSPSGRQRWLSSYFQTSLLFQNFWIRIRYSSKKVSNLGIQHLFRRRLPSIRPKFSNVFA